MENVNLTFSLEQIKNKDTLNVFSDASMRKSNDGTSVGCYYAVAVCGDDMIDRRGGMDYFFKYRNGRKHILKTGTISYADYCVTVAAQFVVCIMPTALRRFIFKKILRK